MKNTSINIFEALNEKILFLDGGMGTELSKLNLNFGCNEELNLKIPDEIQKIHLNYLIAGADIIETNTFGANLISLKEYGLEKKCYEINKKAVEIARKAIEEFKSKGNKFIAGSIGPSNKNLSFSKDIKFEEVEESYFEQVIGLISGGVDFLLIETITDSLNAKCAIQGLKKAFKETGIEVPYVFSLSISNGGKILNGQTIEAFYNTFKSFSPSGFGINCSRGPDGLESALSNLSKICDFPIFFYPNAGIPDEDLNYNFSADRFAKILRSYVKSGFVNVVGGCCGTTPAHIKRLKEEIGDFKPKKRKVKEKIFLSGLEDFEVKKATKPVFAGERCNIKGSKEFREAIFQNDFLKATKILKKQVESGSEIIDIFLQDPERNEKDDFENFLSHILPSFKKTIMLSLQRKNILINSLKKIPGKAIINSVSLEDMKKFKEISKVAKEWGCFLVFQTIGTKVEWRAEKKIEVAKKGFEILTKKIGVRPEDIIFDPVILPVQVLDFSENHIYETLKTLKILKKLFPKNLTILGISNISYGLDQGRSTLNSVFLYYASKYGLDIAILNPKKIKRFFTIPEEERTLAYNLIFKRDKKFFKEFLEYFKGERPVEVKEIIEKSSEEWVKECILNGNGVNLKENLEKLLSNGCEPIKIIEDILIPAMEELGEKFKKNEAILPEVLESASLMKYSLDFLKPFMKKEYKKKARILIATVKGDVHDIGKNLFGTLCEKSGYEVIDLGVKVEVQDLIEGTKKYKPDVVGLSGLLTKSCFEMVEVAKGLSKIQTKPVLLLGGAALTKEFVEKRISPFFKEALFYCSTAMEGLLLLNKFFTKEKI